MAALDDTTLDDFCRLYNQAEATIRLLVPASDDREANVRRGWSVDRLEKRQEELVKAAAKLAEQDLGL